MKGSTKFWIYTGGVFFGYSYLLTYKYLSAWYSVDHKNGDYCNWLGNSRYTSLRCGNPELHDSLLGFISTFNVVVTVSLIVIGIVLIYTKILAPFADKHFSDPELEKKSN